MGNYASNAELKTRFDSADSDAELEVLTDKAPGTGVDDAVLTDVVTLAEADINTRIGRLWATPVDVSIDAELAALMKGRTLDLAEYYLHRRSDHATEVKERQAERALEWATAVGIGTFVLPGGVTPASTQSRDPVAEWTDAARTADPNRGRVCTRNSFSQL